MNINQIREYSVIVNGGSGCIFQPMDEQYSYVLTAKHNITKANNRIETLTRFQFNNQAWSPVIISIEALIENQNYFPHPQKDAAILKIGRIAGLDKAIRKADIDIDRNDYLLIGYPEARRKANPKNVINWYRSDEGVNILGTNADNLREGQIPNNAGIEEVRGHSGGGIVKVVDGYLSVIAKTLSDKKAIFKFQGL